MTPIDALLDAVAWEAVEPEPGEFAPGIPYATHRGTLTIGGVTLRCYCISDGRRIFDASDVRALFPDLLAR